MNWPQIVMIALFAIGLYEAMDKHGKPREDKYSLWVCLAATALNVVILYFGGFWS